MDKFSFLKKTMLYSSLLLFIHCSTQAQTYCTPVGDDCSFDDYIKSFSTTGGTTNITNNNTNCGNLTTGYSSYITMIHSGIPGGTVSYSITNGPTYDAKFGLWVDWNNDGDFADPGEIILQSANPVIGNQVITGTFTIPAAATAGNKRMRVRCTYYDASTLSAAPGPCLLAEGYGETEDYTLNVGAAPTCAAPTVPTATAITGTTASLNWTQTGTPLSWQIKYGTPGFNPATAGTAIITNTKPYTLNPPLAPTTSYDYYVRAICGPGDTSAWSVVKNFTTLCNAPALLSSTDSSRCGPGEVTLKATAAAGATIKWYGAAAGGTTLGTGGTFTTPPITNTTTYYVAAAGGAGGLTNASIATITGGINGCTGGVMFNITPTVDIVVDSFLNLSNATQTTTVTVYYKTGTYVGSELNAAAWTTLGTTPVSTTATMTLIKVGASISMTAGTTYGIFIANMSTGYTDGIGTNQTYTNADLTLNTGAGLCGVFTSTVNSPRVFNGTVYYHKGSSCESPRVPVIATVKAAPVVNLGNDTTICPGISYTFNAGNPGATYAWNTTASSQSITTNAAGTFSVLVTSANGCVASDAINITPGINPVNNLPAVTNLCDGDIANLNAGNAGSSYLWTPGNQTTQTINVSNGGNVSVAVKSTDGCIINSSTNVTIRPLPVDNLGNDTSICDGDQIPLDAGNPGYTYLWSTGANTQVINASDSGTYSVTVTTPYNCVNEEEIHIAYLPSPRVEGFNFIPQFYENLGQVKFAPLNPQNVNSYLWDFGDGSPGSTAINPTHTYTAAGAYLVVLKVFNGCGDFDISLPINVDLATGIVGPAKINAEVMLYPNPSKELVTIDIKTADIDMEEVRVFNILGAEVLNDKTPRSNRHSFSVAGLPSGIYSVRLLTNKGLIVRKFEVLK